MTIEVGFGLGLGFGFAANPKITAYACMTHRPWRGPPDQDLQLTVSLGPDDTTDWREPGRPSVIMTRAVRGNELGGDTRARSPPAALASQERLAVAAADGGGRRGGRRDHWGLGFSGLRRKNT
jgi:hypothetical protein